MARNQPVYVCSSCGGEALKWQGQCPHCSEWNTLSRVIGARAHRELRSPILLQRRLGFADAGASSGETMSLGMSELDRVFGGGLVLGSVSLLGGEPGHRQIDTAFAGRCRDRARTRGAVRLR